MDHVGQVRTGQRVCGFRFLRDPRNPEIGHPYLPPWNGVPPPCLSYAFVTEFDPDRNSTNCRIFQLFQYLSAAAPHVKPPPIASRTTTSPRLIRPSRIAVSKASGTEAAGGRWAAVDEQQVVVAPVRVEFRCQESAVALFGAQNERTGAVAEQNAGGAVLPIEDPAERLGADDQRIARVAGAQHRIGDG